METIKRFWESIGCNGCNLRRILNNPLKRVNQGFFSVKLAAVIAPLKQILNINVNSSDISDIPPGK